MIADVAEVWSLWLRLSPSVYSIHGHGCGRGFTSSNSAWQCQIFLVRGFPHGPNISGSRISARRCWTFWVCGSLYIYSYGWHGGVICGLLQLICLILIMVFECCQYIKAIDDATVSIHSCICFVGQGCYTIIGRTAVPEMLLPSLLLMLNRYQGLSSLPLLLRGSRPTGLGDMGSEV